MNKAYIILIIFSIYFCIFIVSYNLILSYNNYKDINSIQVNKNNCAYRLGDMILHKFHRNKNLGKLCHLTIYPNSIASEYLKKTNKSNDINVLYDIVKKRSNLINLPNNNELIIHIRIGDVIDKRNISVDEFLYNYYYDTNYFFYKLNYVKPYSFYKKIIDKLPKNINKVIFVGGYHYKQDRTKSKEYISKLQKFFNSYGFDTSTRINNDPDEDFIYMSNAAYFVQSGGGFSQLIGNIVKKNKNIVYYDTQNKLNIPFITLFMLILIFIPIYFLFKN